MDNQVHRVPDNTFYHILNTAEPECNGKFTYKNLAGERLYELEYKDGYLSSTGEMKRKNHNARTDQTCIDWYLITTYYNSWGQPIGYTETFVGTTCDEEGSGGGGDTPPEGEDPDAEYAIAKTVDWLVAPNPTNPNSGGGIVSAERIKGKRVSGEPQGGHFTSISHSWSICNICNINFPDDVWSESSCTVSASQQTATSNVSGNWTWSQVDYIVNNSKSWAFSGVFP